MAHSQPKLPSWSGTVISDQLPVTNDQLPVNSEKLPVESEPSPNPLPCLNSSPECISQLTEAAITNSSKLKNLDDRIALINQRLELMAQRIDHAKDKRWTSYITIDPVKLIQNIFGGGDVQRDNLAIADLEVKTADLEAARAELERQREAEKILLGDRVLRLVLDYERSDRTITLIQSQQETFRLQNEVFRIQYRLGEGSTEQLLGMTTRGDRLNEQLTDASIKRDEAVRELLQLTEYGEGQ